MAIVPPAFAARLDRLFTTPTAEAARDLKMLVEETLELVAQHLPQVDAGRARQRLARRRHPWQLPDSGV